MLFSSANDYKRCTEIVRKELSQRNICVSDDVLDKITEDVMNITYAKGGSYSYDIVQCFAKHMWKKSFIKNF